ncbi:hypothetical protein H6A30_13415 [Bacteroides caecigallinarum]|uniref:hypothetical protein n=1 Tax=Bacteroides caecigallinarum TaxID=1411144 RepID=UPI00195C35D2|nr:hypothetical protein [Bacteroides caecigallinarum]MBM6891230.1 hypothetical protein [Bacteroides caecigallinarum]
MHHIIMISLISVNIGYFTTCINFLYEENLRFYLLISGLTIFYAGIYSLVICLHRRIKFGSAESKNYKYEIWAIITLLLSIIILLIVPMLA